MPFEIKLHLQQHQKTLEILGVPETERDLRQQFVIYGHRTREKESQPQLPTQQRKSTDCYQTDPKPTFLL